MIAENTDAFFGSNLEGEQIRCCDIVQRKTRVNKGDAYLREPRIGKPVQLYTRLCLAG